MKKIMTKERFAGLEKTDAKYKEVVENCYQEVLDFVSGAIGTASMTDEPLLAAALETYANALKANMQDTEKEIYEYVKELGVTGYMVQKKTEE